MMQKQVNNEQREELFAGIEQEVEGAEAGLTTPSGSTGGVGGTAVSVPLRVSVSAAQGQYCGQGDCDCDRG